MQENNQIDIRAWLLRILRNWYWFLLSGVVFGALGVMQYLSSPNKFEVKSEIMLRGGDDGSAFIKTEMLDLLGMKGAKVVDDEIATLTSRDAISRVINDLNLQVEYQKKTPLRWVSQYPKGDVVILCSPEYLDTMALTCKIDIKARRKDYVVKVEKGARLRSKHIVTDLNEPFETCMGELQLKVLNPEEVQPGFRYKITVYSRSVAVSLYKLRINVAAIKKDSKVIAISSTTDTPRRVKEYMQKLIEYYNADAVADKNLIAQNTAAFIEERLRVLENELREAEESAVKYLEKYNLVDPDFESRLFLEEDIEYTRQLADVETQIKMIDYLCEFMDSKANEDDLLPAMFTITTYQSEQDESKVAKANLASLSLISAIDDYNALIMKKMRLTGSSAETDQINAELAILRANIKTTVKNVREALVIAKQDLDKYFVEADARRKHMPDHIRNYDKLDREKDLKEDLYLYMCEEYEENAMLLASNILPIKIITTPQTNPLRVSPSYMTILVFLVIGLLLPLGAMVIFDMLNNRVLSIKDLETRTKMPLVGSLVKVANGEIVMRDGANSMAAELFRTLRTNIRFMLPAKEQCAVLLVTSSIDNEGKSYVASNLAMSMTMLGKKVALVGLDVRKPTLAKDLNLPSQGCLTKYLSDDTYTLDDIIVPTSIPNLDALPAGVVPPNPSELLQSERLDVLFEELRKRYDYVVVDTAPLAMVSDTYLLNRVADMTLCVVRAGHTTFDLLRIINQAYDQQRLPKMAAVLNSVDAKKLKLF